MSAGTSPSLPPNDSAWTDPELANPHASADKATKVRGMFSAIAPSYDLNNRVHSFGRDQRWRRKAVRLAGVKPGDHVLDVACGTGDLTQLFARTDAARVVGVDFTPAMLAIARQKLFSQSSRVAAKVTYADGDAQHLAYPDQSFDVVSIAFGIRNVMDPAQALREFERVLKPGGRLIVLEFGQPTNPLVRWFNGIYCARLMPRTATLISGDKSGAYKYLPASVGTFWTLDQMQQAISTTGFTGTSATSMFFGVCVCYRAIKP